MVQHGEVLGDCNLIFIPAPSVERPSLRHSSHLNVDSGQVNLRGNDIRRVKKLRNKVTVQVGGAYRGFRSVCRL